MKTNVIAPGRNTKLRTTSIRRSTCAYCLLCKKFVELKGFDESAAAFNTDLQDIEFLANSGQLHRVHNRKGEVMICSDSLFQCFDSRRTRLLDTAFVTNGGKN